MHRGTPAVRALQEGVPTERYRRAPDDVQLPLQQSKTMPVLRRPVLSGSHFRPRIRVREQDPEMRDLPEKRNHAR